MTLRGQWPAHAHPAGVRAAVLTQVSQTLKRFQRSLPWPADPSAVPIICVKFILPSVLRGIFQTTHPYFMFHAFPLHFRQSPNSSTRQSKLPEVERAHPSRLSHLSWCHAPSFSPDPTWDSQVSTAATTLVSLPVPWTEPVFQPHFYAKAPPPPISLPLSPRSKSAPLPS